MRLDLGGKFGAIPVASGGSHTATAGFVIYAVVPQSSWIGKAIAVDGFAHMTADGSATGGDMPTGRTNPFYGAYSSVTNATGSVCDVYELPADEVVK